MKTVRTLAQATKTAAQSGAVLEVGGRLINSGGAKLSVIKPAPKAEPASSAPPPAPSAPDTTTVDALAHMIALQAEAQRKTMLDILDRLQAPTVQAPVMRPVSFAVVRDSDGQPSVLIPRYGPGPATKPKSIDAKKGADGFITEIIPRY